MAIFNSQGQPVNMEALVNAVTSLSGTSAVFMVSSLTTVGYISAFIDNGSISAKSSDATTMRTSAIQGDGALLRVSSLNSAATTNTGGLTLFSTSAGIAQLSTIKSAAGRLYGYHLGHGAGVDQYLAVFDSTTATLGTTVPTLRLLVPAGTGQNAGAGAIGNFYPGIAFATGIQIAVVSGSGGDGNTAGASAMRVNLFYA